MSTDTVTIFAAVCATISVFFVGYYVGAHYTWRSVRRTTIETVAMGRAKNPKRRA